MKILIAAKHAPHGSKPIGGVQSWSRTVCRELERRGHDVRTWGPEQPRPEGKFDFGIIANLSDTAPVVSSCKKTIVICHGIIPAENPNYGNTGPVAFTSEEIRDHWKLNGEVIRQPIDLEFWTPSTDERAYLTRFSYRSGLRYVPRIATSLGLIYRHVKNLDSRSVREVLRQSVCVLATGRAALEAMACGSPVVIVDHRSAYQKPLMDLDIPSAMTRNYSGRGGITPTPENLKAAIQWAIKTGPDRDHVFKHHCVSAIADQLLEYA